MSQRMGTTEWLMLLTLALIWGASFIFNALALEAFSTEVIVFARVVIGAVFLTLLLAMMGVYLPRDAAVWRTFLVMAMLQNVLPFTLIVWGQQHVSAGLASIFNGTTPFFTVLVAQAFTSDEKITPLKALGLLAGFIGVVIIIGPEALDGLSDAGLGKFAILAASLCYGLSLVWARRFSGLKPGVAPAGMLWCSSLIMVPFAALSVAYGGVWQIAEVPTLSIIALFGLGILCSAIAYLLFFVIIKRAGATNASLVTFIIPISAVGMGYLFLGEVLSLSVLPGVVMIFIGLMLVDGRVFIKGVKKAL